MSVELARERINILDIKEVDGTVWVFFEYQYVNKSGSTVWQKDIMLCEKGWSNILQIEQAVLEHVREMKAELE